MIDNVYELSSPPAFGLSTQPDKFNQYRPQDAELLISTAKMAVDLLVDLQLNQVDYDSSVKILQKDLEDTVISTDSSWKLTETRCGGAPLIDINNGNSIETFSYFKGFVLTQYGEILEYEKSAKAKDDMGLIHVSGLHRGTFIRHGRLSRNGYVDISITNALDNLAQRAGLGQITR